MSATAARLRRPELGSRSATRPSIASCSVGNGECPVRRYESNTPSVHTSAGGAWYGCLRRISEDAYAVVPKKSV